MSEEIEVGRVQDKDKAPATASALTTPKNQHFELVERQTASTSTRNSCAHPYDL